MGKSYNDLHMETMKEKMIKLNQEYEKTKLLMEYKKWVRKFARKTVETKIHDMDNWTIGHKP